MNAVTPVAIRATAPYRMEAGALAGALGTDLERGLSAAEAAHRLAAEGPNELLSVAAVPKWRKLLKQFQDPLIYLLLAAVAISVVAWVLEGAVGVPVDAVVITLIVVFNAVLGYVQEAKAADAVAALRAMTEATSTVIRDGEALRIPSRDLVRGDLLMLAEGDRIGADARLVRATALRVQEASLTGESAAVHKTTAPIPAEVALGDRTNMAYQGTAVAQGVGRALVTHTGMGTEMGRIAQMLETTREDPTPLQREIGGLGRSLGFAVIAIALVVVATTLLISDVRTPSDYVVVLLLGVSLAVAAVPEGLPAVLSVVLAVGVQRMAGRKAIVKNLSSVETLGSASVIASDKTGTLTRSEMTIQRIITASGEVEVTGTGYGPEGAVMRHGRPVDDPAQIQELQLLLSAGSRANDARLVRDDKGEWTIQGDPTEGAFLVASKKLAGTVEMSAAFVRRGEVPFTSERKMMSVLDTAPDRTRLFSKGAPDVLLTHCTGVRVGAEVVPLTEERRAALLAQVEDLSAQAYRTLGVAYRPFDEDMADEVNEALEEQLVYLGVVGIIDPPRSEAATAIADARRAGIRVMMITCDHPITAARIAADLGIVEPGARARTGLELSQLDAQGWRETVRETSVYARVAPEHKLKIVDALQADGSVVAMTGDGVNDAPALKSADIGIAMGLTGTEVTKEAAKMILADDNFATIVAAVREGRSIFDNIRKVLRYLLSSNMGEVLTVFLGVILAGVLGLRHGNGGIVLPLLATQILWINLVTDSAPALAMGVDPAVDDPMARAPRKPTDKVIGLGMWVHMIWLGLVMAVVVLTTIDLFHVGGQLAGESSLEIARTAGFTVLVLIQLFNAFNSRSMEHSAFYRVFSNPWLVGAILLGLVLQILVVEVPFLQVAFGTVPLTLGQWGICVAMASIVLWVEEIRKFVAWLVRR
jgi:P-type Ca2+ transporter type 2C